MSKAAKVASCAIGATICGLIAYHEYNAYSAMATKPTDYDFTKYNKFTFCEVENYVFIAFSMFAIMLISGALLFLFEPKENATQKELENGKIGMCMSQIITAAICVICGILLKTQISPTGSVTSADSNISMLQNQYCNNLMMWTLFIMAIMFVGIAIWIMKDGITEEVVTDDPNTDDSIGYYTTTDAPKRASTSIVKRQSPDQIDCWQ